MAQDAILATIPGDNEHERLLVMLRHTGDGQSRLVLVQQNHGGGVGWYNQRSVEVDSQQVAMLRGVLGLGASQMPKDTEPPRPILKFPELQSA